MGDWITHYLSSRHNHQSFCYHFGDETCSVEVVNSSECFGGPKCSKDKTNVNLVIAQH